MTSADRAGEDGRRDAFLFRMDQSIAWDELASTLEPDFVESGLAASSCGLGVLLRIYFLQQSFGLSDSAVRQALGEVEAMRQFAGLSASKELMPDEAIIRQFRQFVEADAL